MRLDEVYPNEIDSTNLEFRADFHTRQHPKSTISKVSTAHCFTEKCSPVRRFSVCPVVTVETSETEKPVLITGFKEFHSLKKNLKIPVLIIESEDLIKAAESYGLECLIATSTLPEWRIAAWIYALEFASKDRFTPLELAAFIQKASKTLKISKDQAAAFCFEDTSNRLVKAIVKASELPKSILSRLQLWNIDVLKASLLSHYSFQERPKAIVLACVMLRLSVSNLRQIERLLRDIALRQNTSVFLALKNCRKHLQQHLTSPDSDLTEYCMKTLETWRSPVKTEVDRKFYEQLGSIKNKHTVRIEPPPNY